MKRPISTWLSMLLCACCSWLNADFVTVVNNGKSSNRVDIVTVGDGYRASEISTTYSSNVNSFVSYLLGGSQTPFPRYSKFFNVHQVNVISNQSGADIPQLGITRDTALGSSYRWDGVTDRLLYLNEFTANSMVSAQLAGTGIDVDMRVGIVNESVYGGGGGNWAVYAGGNASAREIAVHEIGHSFARLADEYFSPGTYVGAEPVEANVTKSPTAGKWDRWVGYNDPTSNIGPIGYYEGGKYVQNGIYRPSDNSKMRALDRPFDAVSREAFIQAIYNEVNPLDEWRATSDVLSASDLAWVKSLDPTVINIKWSLNDSLLAFTGESLDISLLGLAPGTYTLKALAYDSLLDHSNTGDALDWWRLGSGALSQSVSWQLSISAVPEASSMGWLVIVVGVGRFLRNRQPI